MSDDAQPPGSLGAAVAAVAVRWPTLLAWFLTGWLARELLLRLAGDLGNDNAVYGLLVLPLAVLARLVSYVAMFTVVHDALVPGADAAPEGAWRRFRYGGRRVGESVLEAILPFFLIYAAWAILDEDVIAYARSAQDQLDIDTYTGQNALSVSLGVMSVSMVVIAFGLRRVLSWLEDRVPRWTQALAVYLEAVWVLVTVLVLGDLIAAVPQWLESRRMVSWGLDRVDDLRESVAWVGHLVDGLAPAWGVVSDVVLLPLAWLALAGVVFAHTISSRAGAHDPHAVTRVRARYASLTGRWRRVVDWATGALVERWEPVRRIATLAWRAGPLPIAAYLLAFALVQALTSWLYVGFTHGAGPHELGWWGGVDATVTLVIDAVVVPLQLAVVAAALVALSDRAARRAPVAAPAAAAAAS